MALMKSTQDLKSSLTICGNENPRDDGLYMWQASVCIFNLYNNDSANKQFCKKTVERIKSRLSKKLEEKLGVNNENQGD